MQAAASAWACNFLGDVTFMNKDDPRALWRTISPGFFTSLAFLSLPAGLHRSMTRTQSRS